jgi:hypothetical protein
VEAGRAIFPLRRPSDPFLPDEDRDHLWNLFGVPVLALLVDGNNGVVGYECEAQNGFHLAPGCRAGLLFGVLAIATCDCGRPGPRLVRLRSKYERPVPVGALSRSAEARLR